MTRCRVAGYMEMARYRGTYSRIAPNRHLIPVESSALYELLRICNIALNHRRPTLKTVLTYLGLPFAWIGIFFLMGFAYVTKARTSKWHKWEI